MALGTTNPSIISTSQLDARALRHALGSFATGVTIVTAMSPTNGPIGFTANSFTSVSLAPPLILVCIAKSAAGYAIYNAASAYCVNILAQNQHDLAGTFAARGADKFSGVSWHQGATGAPILDGSVGHFDCAAHEMVEAGDHAILIGRVVGFNTSDTEPLCYHRGKYAALAREHPTPANYVAARTSEPPHLNRTRVQHMGDPS